MPYAVSFTASAAATFSKLPTDAQRRIAAKVDALILAPRPPGAEKLQGEEALYRVRVGDYRIVYRVDDGRLLVLVVRVAHRSDVYRQLARSRR